MELEEMQTVWSQMSGQLEQQKKLTDKIIIEMTQQKFKNRFSTLSFYEVLGAFICFAAAVVIVLNLDKMNTWYLMGCSILSIIFFLVLPIISLRSLYGMKHLNLTTNNYKETLVEFTKKKKRMLLIQRSGAALSALLMWLVVPVFMMAFNNKDFFQTEKSTGLLIFYAATTIGIIIFARWGYGCYKSITARAEADLKELEA
ncbi:hypothetical protein [Marixanthomonas ophiurae]|uniref:DUF3278 domain-containing protein n=1 Tax=Marixanthomonas ophiurae TaxID=387659 RepID=A0A3E1Q7T1_9FLAO|nr:hypothetical protein [Marixanthomonas ophiurae]RFN58186.1 hypothetical protein DZ858_13215 [Marixanthomonas ophiurae]